MVQEPICLFRILHIPLPRSRISCLPSLLFARNQEMTSMQLAPRQLAALAFDPSLLFTLRDWKIDAWQRNLLRGREPRVLLNCCRQAGKSTVGAALALHTAMLPPRSTILL